VELIPKLPQVNVREFFLKKGQGALNYVMCKGYISFLDVEGYMLLG